MSNKQGPAGPAPEHQRHKRKDAEEAQKSNPSSGRGYVGDATADTTLKLCWY